MLTLAAAALSLPLLVASDSAATKTLDSAKAFLCSGMNCNIKVNSDPLPLDINEYTSTVYVQQAYAGGELNITGTGSLIQFPDKCSYSALQLTIPLNPPVRTYVTTFDDKKKGKKYTWHRTPSVSDHIACTVQSSDDDLNTTKLEYLGVAFVNEILSNGWIATNDEGDKAVALFQNVYTKKDTAFISMPGTANQTLFSFIDFTPKSDADYYGVPDVLKAICSSGVPEELAQTPHHIIAKQVSNDLHTRKHYL